MTPLRARRLAVPRLALWLAPTLAVMLMLGGCDPQYNWRDYRSKDAPYSVLLPGKPATHTRDVRLGELPVRMTMTAAEVDHVVFAVGSAELADAAQTQGALLAMQTALARNIGASISSQITSQTTGQITSQITSHAVAKGAQTTVSIEAKGLRNGEPTLLIGRFIARERRVYQVVVMGAERHIVREQVETFLTSFQLQQAGQALK